MEWSACYSTSLEATAHLVKGYLEQYGVPCVLAGGSIAGAALGVGEVRVLVRADWLRVAKGLLRDREPRVASARLRLVGRSEPS